MDWNGMTDKADELNSDSSEIFSFVDTSKRFTHSVSKISDKLYIYTMYSISNQ